jgi:ABC-2 type transport system permease protein
VWMRLGVAVNQRVNESAGIGILAALCIFGCSFVHASWDTSEARGNSFSKADEHALLQIHAPLRIEVHLAAEDPRRLDLEHRALGKLRRILPKTEVRYVAATSIGLFEQTSAGYGEIWYELDGRRTMGRATTEEGVLEAIYSLAGIAPPKESDDEVFRGHPLAVSAKGGGAIFYGFWPGLVALGGFLFRRRFQ